MEDPGTLAVITGMLDRLPTVNCTLSPRDKYCRYPGHFAITMIPNEGSMMDEALKFMGFDGAPEITAAFSFSIAPAGVECTISTSTMTLDMGDDSAVTDFQLSLFSTIAFGAKPRFVVGIKVSILEILVQGGYLQFSGQLAVGTTGFYGELQMHNPTVFQVLTPHFALLVPTVDEPLKLGFGINPFLPMPEMTIKLGVTALMDEEKTHETQFDVEHDHLAGTANCLGIPATEGKTCGGIVYSECLTRDTCATVSFALDMVLKFTATIPPLFTPKKIAFTVEILGSISVPMVLKSVTGIELDPAAADACNKFIGKFGPAMVDLVLSTNPAVPKFELDVIAHAATTTTAIMAEMHVAVPLPKGDSMTFTATLSAGCLGLDLGGCTGVMLESTPTGAEAFTIIRNRFEDYFGDKWNDLMLAPILRTPEQAGPGVIIVMGRDMRLTIEASGAVVLGPAPAAFNKLLPSAYVYADVSKKGMEMELNFQMMGLVVDFAFDMTFKPKMRLNLFYMQFDATMLIENIKNAIRDFSSTLYKILDFIGLFSILVPQRFSLLYDGATLTIEMDLILFGSQTHFEISINMGMLFAMIDAVANGGLSMDLVTGVADGISAQLSSMSPCKCVDDCRAVAKKTWVIGMKDATIPCPKLIMEETCGPNLLCGINVVMKESCHQICAWGCWSVCVPYPETSLKSCCLEFPKMIMSTCEISIPHLRFEYSGDLATRRRQCKALGFPVPCAFGLATGMLGLPGIPILESDRHC